jgi:hypothetical protein
MGPGRHRPEPPRKREGAATPAGPSVRGPPGGPGGRAAGKSFLAGRR